MEAEMRNMWVLTKEPVGLKENYHLEGMMMELDLEALPEGGLQNLPVQ